MNIVQKQLTTAAFPTSASPIARESTSTHESVEKLKLDYEFIKLFIWVSYHSRTISYYKKILTWNKSTNGNDRNAKQAA